jgi:hypothetical protein
MSENRDVSMDSLHSNLPAASHVVGVLQVRISSQHKE